MLLLRRPGFWLELGASLFTLTGIYIGSTTLIGAILYLISSGFWHVIAWSKGLHGIVPLNVATTVIALLNIWRAL
jgi:hypothetical protein